MRFTDYLTEEKNDKLDEAKIKGTYITYKTKSLGEINGPFGTEESYKTTFFMDNDIVADVTTANQGILDCVVKDKLALGGLLNSLLEL